MEKRRPRRFRIRKSKLSNRSDGDVASPRCPEGKNEFFARYFKTPLTSDEQTRLAAIANLTPGDFRTVREELFYLSDKQSNAERLDALEAESQAKGAAPAKIGF